MRKLAIATVFFLALASVIIWAALSPPILGERRILHELSSAFLEDLQFKDFRSSGLYHHPFEQDRVDIGKALERLFLVKPELLNIRDFRLVQNEVDSTGRRGRTLVNVQFDVLNRDDNPREADLMLYWMRRHPDCPLGTECEGGVCVNESGQKALRDESGDDEEDEPFACDDQAERQWFMNLDSTLESRDYR